MKEFGGYLPLEICSKEAYYKKNKNMDVLEFNSGKAAIYYALKESNVKAVYIPYYICQSVVKIAEYAGVEIKRYFIDNEFMPEHIDVNRGEMVILVNYFGIVHEKIRQIYSKFPCVLIDNTQAFFAKPVLEKNVYNAYSCKKFIGVPDGGYLIGKAINKKMYQKLEKDHSSQNMEFCLTNIEYGTAFGYQKKKENDKRFLTQIRRMSDVTYKILESTDYEFVKKKRVDNFIEIHRRLEQYNMLNLEDIDFVPYYYPFFWHKDIRKELVERKVYVPTLWQELISDEFNGSYEKEFSERIAFLPLDQRYSIEDMTEVCNRVMESIGKK